MRSGFTVQWSTNGFALINPSGMKSHTQGQFNGKRRLNLVPAIANGLRRRMNKSAEHHNPVIMIDGCMLKVILQYCRQTFGQT